MLSSLVPGQTFVARWRKLDVARLVMTEKGEAVDQEEKKDFDLDTVEEEVVAVNNKKQSFHDFELFICAFVKYILCNTIIEFGYILKILIMRHQ